MVRSILWVALALIVSSLSAQPLNAQEQDDTPPEPFINKIIFEGAVNIDHGRLRKLMRTRQPSWRAIFRRPRLDRNLLRRDIAQLEGYYHSVGFFEAEVRLGRLDLSDDGQFVDIVIEIDEGRPTRVTTVSFSANSLIDHDELTKGLRLNPGEPYNASLVDTDLYTIRTKYFDRGYLAVSVTDSVTVEDRSARIRYQIEPGTQIYIANISVVGNTTIKRSIVDKELTFAEGELCRLRDLLNTQRNLFETGLFTLVDIDPTNLDPLERTVDVMVRLRERKVTYVELGFGVGNIVGSRVAAEWGTRNLLGTGRGLRLRSEYAFDVFEDDEFDLSRIRLQNRFYRYDAEFQQRWLFGVKALLALNTFYEKDATLDQVEVKTLGTSIGSTRRLSRYTDLNLTLSTERIEREELGEAEDVSTKNIISTRLVQDRRDFILDPQSGVYRAVEFGVAGGILAGDSDFFTTSATYQRYYRLSPGYVFAWRVRGGAADIYGGSSEVPVENRFFSGGGSSVRGYDENSLGPREADDNGDLIPVGGRVLMLTNAELRYPMPVLSRFKVSGVLFADAGNVWASGRAARDANFRLYSSKQETTTDDYRYSVGLGLRYNTPIGPIRFDWGLPIKQDAFTDKGGRFHISLGQIF